VTDGAGGFVRDLVSDDFELLVDGRPEPIQAFTLVDIPRETAAGYTERTERGVATNVAADNGAIYVMLLDDLHVASENSAWLRNVARQFITDQLASNDLMAVTSVAGGAAKTHVFTSNKDVLLAAVDAFTGQKGVLDSGTNMYATAAAGTPNLGFGPTAELPSAASLDRMTGSEQEQRGRSAFATLRAIAESLSSVRGRRKAVLFLSEGIPDSLTLEGPAQSQYAQAVQDAIAAANRGNVSIYGIDPRGLQGLAEARLSAVASQHQTHLLLAEQTGGLAVLRTDNFSDAFDRLAEENRAYYLLGFQPPASREGHEHRLEVRVRRSGTSVKARPSYSQPRGRQDREDAPDERINTAMNGPSAVPGLPLRLFATPFRDDDVASVLLGIELQGRSFVSTPRGRVALTYVAVDEAGRVQLSRRQTLTLSLSPEDRQRADAGGLRTLQRVSLEAGTYQVRVVALDLVGGGLGSVVANLEVPDFSAPLSMSGILLGAPDGFEGVSAGVDDASQQAVPAGPVSQREFEASGELTAYAELYRANFSGPVEITTRVTSAELGAVYYEGFETWRPQAGEDSYPLISHVPLATIPPGSHLFSIEARSLSSGEVVASRRLRFDVVPAAAPLEP